VNLCAGCGFRSHGNANHSISRRLVQSSESAALYVLISAYVVTRGHSQGRSLRLAYWSRREISSIFGASNSIGRHSHPRRSVEEKRISYNIFIFPWLLRHTLFSELNSTYFQCVFAVESRFAFLHLSEIIVSRSSGFRRFISRIHPHFHKYTTLTLFQDFDDGIYSRAAQD